MTQHLLKFPERVELIVLIVILFVALVVRLWGINFGLPYKYHIDEPPYVVAALKIASGDLHILYPYNSPNIFQLLLTFEYGVFFVIGLLAGFFDSSADVAKLYQEDPSIFFLLARGTSAIFSSITVLLTFLLGRLLANRHVGLLAALILTLSFASARDAHYATTDSLVTMLVMGALLLAVAFVQSGSWYCLGIGSLFGGAAVGLKFLPVAVLVIFAGAILWRYKDEKSKRHGRLFSASVTSVGLSMVGFLVAFPAPLIDLTLFMTHWHQVWEQGTSVLGNFIVDPAPAWLYYGKVIVWGMAWPVCLAALGGLIVAIRGQWRRGWWIILIFVVVYYVTISLVRTYFARYALPLMPPLALLSALAIVQIHRIMLNRQFSPRYAQTVTGFFIVLLCIVPTANLIRHNVLLSRQDTRTLAKSWIETHIPEGTHIVVQWYGPPLATRQDPEPGSSRIYVLTVLDPFTTSEASYSLATYTENGASYFILNDWNERFVRQDRQENLIRQQFYHGLQAESDLVAEFNPKIEPTADSTSFFWEQIYGPAIELWQLDRPGPTIKVYKIQP